MFTFFSPPDPGLAEAEDEDVLLGTMAPPGGVGVCCCCWAPPLPPPPLAATELLFPPLEATEGLTKSAQIGDIADILRPNHADPARADAKPADRATLGSLGQRKGH